MKKTWIGCVAVAMSVVALAAGASSVARADAPSATLGGGAATQLIECSSTMWVCSSLDGSSQVCCNYDQQCQTYGDSGAYCQ